MKKLERILWGVIGAMIVVWIALWFLVVWPLKGEDGQQGLVEDLKLLKDGKGSARSKKTKKPLYKNWGLQDFADQATRKDRTDFPSKKRIEILEEHREYLREQYDECLNFFMKQDAPLEIWFGGGSKLDESEFHAVFETEMGKLEQRLMDAGIRIATPQKSGRGGTSKIVGLDRATHLDISKMQKNFWIQSAIVDSMISENRDDAPRIWKLNYIKCGQWGSSGSGRPDGDMSEHEKEIARYFDLIKISFEVEIMAPDVPVLLRKILASGRIHFHPHAFQVRTIQIKNEKNELVIPESFAVNREGKALKVKVTDGQEFADLRIKQPTVLPAVLPLRPHSVIDFGKRKQGDTADIPSQAELLKNLLGETLAEGEEYPYDEPPVILEVFLFVRDYARARVQKMLEEAESDSRPARKGKSAREKD